MTENLIHSEEGYLKYVPLTQELAFPFPRNVVYLFFILLSKSQKAFDLKK